MTLEGIARRIGFVLRKDRVAIGIDETNSSARISRYELGLHEPPIPTARLIADALSVPLVDFQCEDDHVASLLLALHRLGSRERRFACRQVAGIYQIAVGIPVLAKLHLGYVH